MYAEMFWALSCLTSSSASALFGDALICTVKSGPCAPASPNNNRTSANGMNGLYRSLILRKTSVLGLREERFKRMESEIMHEIGEWIKTGEVSPIMFSRDFRRGESRALSLR